MNTAERDELLSQARDAIQELADAGYINDTSATLALLAIDIGVRRASEWPTTNGHQSV